MNEREYPENKLETTISSPQYLSQQEPSPSLEYVPLFLHQQEDLKYMFQIDVNTEDDLHTPKIKQQMYEACILELQMGTPHAFDYFFNEKLLTKDDIKQEDLPILKSYALKILDMFKGPRLVTARNLFLELGIIDKN